MERISARDHEGQKCPSVVPFKILHSKGPFEEDYICVSEQHCGVSLLNESTFLIKSSESMIQLPI